MAPLSIRVYVPGRLDGRYDRGKASCMEAGGQPQLRSASVEAFLVLACLESMLCARLRSSGWSRNGVKALYSLQYFPQQVQRDAVMFVRFVSI